MENEAVVDLTAIAQARAAVADRLITPWWYHPVLGLLIAGYVLGVSLGTSTVRLTVAMLFAVSCLGLVSVYRRLTGVWVSGFEAGRASRWAYALGVLLAVVTAGAWALAWWTHLSWPSVCLAVVAFVGTNVLGRRFDVELRDQLRAGA